MQVLQQYLERKPHADLHTAEIRKLYRCVLKIKVLYEQTRELTHDFLDYV